MSSSSDSVESLRVALIVPAPLATAGYVRAISHGPGPGERRYWWAWSIPPPVLNFVVPPVAVVVARPPRRQAAVQARIAIHLLYARRAA